MKTDKPNDQFYQYLYYFEMWKSVSEQFLNRIETLFDIFCKCFISDPESSLNYFLSIEYLSISIKERDTQTLQKLLTVPTI